MKLTTKYIYSIRLVVQKTIIIVGKKILTTEN